MPREQENKFTMSYSNWQLIKDLLELIKPYKWRFIFASLSRLAGDIAWLYPAFAYAGIITFLTHYTSGQSLNPLWIIAGLWFAATVTRSLGQFIAKYFGYQVAEKTAIDASRKTIQHLFFLDMAWHERENSGNKIKRIQNAAEGINNIIRIWFNTLIETTVNLVVINIIIAGFDRLVLVLLLLFLATYALISISMRKRRDVAFYEVSAQEEEVNGYLFEAINNIRTVKVMSMMKTVYGVLVKSTEELFKKLGTRIFWSQSRSSILSFWAVSCRLGIMMFIVYGIIHGRYEVGFLILFSTYFGNLRESIDELSNASQEYAKANIGMARMKAILDEPITIDNETGKALFPQNWKSIRFQNVSFAYGDNKVLNDVSFEVHRGEKLGIVGLSGAGKSTVFKLLLKEREEWNGDILIDNLSLKQISKQDYFKHIAVVMQDTEVFNFSLKENITMTNAKQKSNQTLIKQALKTAHISDFIDKLPEGLETLIGEKGIKLSGGERQRLGIARAIFRQPQILLLDEATSHLDLESEEKIRDSLHAFFEHVTAIVIAHRLTTIKEMDRILVLEQGKIIESGSFAELYAKRGRFYDLWEKQKL